MSLLAVGSIIEAVGKVAGDLITTDKEKMEMEIEQRKLDLEEKRIDQATDLAQIEVNKIEAASSSVFVSGWRPAIGWIGVAAMGYQFLLIRCFSGLGSTCRLWAGFLWVWILPQCSRLTSFGSFCQAYWESLVCALLRRLRVWQASNLVTS
jgi:hypothetical protein